PTASTAPGNAPLSTSARTYATTSARRVLSSPSDDGPARGMPALAGTGAPSLAAGRPHAAISTASVSVTGRVTAVARGPSGPSRGRNPAGCEWGGGDRKSVVGERAGIRGAVGPRQGREAVVGARWGGERRGRAGGTEVDECAARCADVT